MDCEEQLKEARKLILDLLREAMLGNLADIEYKAREYLRTCESN